MPFDAAPCDKKCRSEHQTLFPVFGGGIGDETRPRMGQKLQNGSGTHLEGGAADTCAQGVVLATGYKYSRTSAARVQAVQSLLPSIPSSAVRI